MRDRAVAGVLAGAVPLLVVLTACASSLPLVKSQPSQQCAPVTTAARARPSSPPSSSPKGVLAAIAAAMLAQKSVHVTESVGEDLVGTTTYAIDATGACASERVGFYGKTMHVLFVNDTVYVRGDAELLQARVGLTAAQARRYAGHWISIPQTRVTRTPLYSEWAGGLTLASIVRSVTPQSGSWNWKLKLLKEKSHRTALYDVRWAPPTQPIPMYELKARASRAPLPVTYSGGGIGNYTSVHFSNWNEAVQVMAPKHSVPIATVRRS